MKDPQFSPQRLYEILQRLPAARRYWVAYSGGCDSHALLHALVDLQAQLSGVSIVAVHIDHGLHPDSAVWAQHCRDVCEKLYVEYVGRRVDARAPPGASREASARQARYAAFASLIAAGDVLLTAQHQDDQAETVLLQLLRGAGPAGLATMPFFNEFHAGILARPLLGFRRAALLAYARAHGLCWLEDPSNADVTLERNYLRHHVMPVVGKQWPASAKVLGRVALLQAEADELLQELARQDLQQARDTAPAALKVAGLLGLSAARQRNALRCWLREQSLPIPSAAQLRRIQQDILYAQADALPRVQWANVELRRYRDVIYVMPQVTSAVWTIPIAWSFEHPLPLPDGTALGAYRILGEGLKQELCQQVSVRFRQGGERCRPRGQVHHRTVKNLFQEHGIPPWQRERQPLIYIGEQLAAIVGVCVCEPFAARADEPGMRIEWLASP